MKDSWRSKSSQHCSGDIEVARVCSASSKLARAGTMDDTHCCGLQRVWQITMLWACTGGFDDVFVCGQARTAVSTDRLRLEYETSTMEFGRATRAPLRAIIVEWERGVLSSGHQPQAVFRGFVVHKKCVRNFVCASRAGRHWLFERFTRDRRIRPQRCVTPILFTRICFCPSSGNLRALLQGPCVSVKKKGSVS